MRRAFNALNTACSALLLLAAGQTVAQTNYPSRPVQIIVAFQAGQGTDVATRFLAERLTKAMGQNFLIDNRPGAAGNIGTAAAAKAAPDGYTLIMGVAGTHGMNPFLFDNPGFDAEKDFDPIIATGMIPMAISVNKSLNVNNLQELIAAAKARPDKIDVALPSSTARIVNQLLRQRADAPLFGVVYKGSATAVPEVISGQVPVLIDTVIATRPHLDKLKAIAITSATSSAMLPGVPSVAEQGVAGFEVTAWNVLMAPAGTPLPIRQRLHDEMAKILSDPQTVKRMGELGFDPAPQLRMDQLGDWLNAERRKFGELIKAAKMKAS